MDEVSVDEQKGEFPSLADSYHFQVLEFPLADPPHVLVVLIHVSSFGRIFPSRLFCTYQRLISSRYAICKKSIESLSTHV